MNFYRRYSLIIGLFLLAIVIALLVSTPFSIFSKGVFIDTDFQGPSVNKAYVTTKLDFGDNETVNAFPKEIGGWQGYDIDFEEYRELLGADVLLQREYYRYYLPIFFLIMQSRTESSFHPPPVCYRSQGYQIEEEGKDEILVSNTTWVEAGASSAEMPIAVNKLVVHKEAGGQVTERRVVIYFYVRGNQFTSNTITMIEVSGLVPIGESYDGTLGMIKDFAAQTIPFMFAPAEKDTGKTVARQLVGWGVGGYFAIAILLLIPLGIIIYPHIRRSRLSDAEPKPQK